MTESPDSPRRSAAGLWTVFAAALVFRLVLYAVLPPPTYSPDSPNYTEPADSIAAGRGLVTINVDDGGHPTPLLVNEPGYSFFLAFWKIVGLGDIQSLVLVQIFLAALLAPAIYTYVLRRTDETVALVAALVYAFDPLAGGTCFYILRELFTMLVIFAAVSALDLVSRGTSAVKGAFLGLGALSFPLLMLWSIAVWILDRVLSPHSRRVGVAALIVAWFVAGGWMLRNAILSKGQLLVRRHSTAVLLYYTSHYNFNWIADTSSPEFRKLVEKQYTEFGVHGTVQQRDYETRVLKATWEKFRAEPGRVVWRFVTCNFWFWAEVPGAASLVKQKPAIHKILRAYHWIQLALMAAGVAALIALNLTGSFRFVWGTVFYLAIFVVPFMPIPRYYAPFLPLIDILASIGLVSLVRRMSRA